VNPILEAALEVQSFCRAQGWRFCIIGAIAVQRWGEPRLTQDVDVTVLSGFGSEREFVDALLSGYGRRIPDARDFALEHRVVLIESRTGVPIDVALGGIPFEERVVSRASAFDVGGPEPLLTCSAEDLVVLKTFAGRDKDWIDVEGVVTRQGKELDAGLVLRELKPLLELKDDTRSLPRLQAILDQTAED
jgi:hypothetical protein